MKNAYRYTECGLDNVVISGASFVTDDAGEDAVNIPNVNGLHQAIALGIVGAKRGLSGKELRFLRTEMGMTQAELASLLHREALTVSRWERNESPIDENAETLIRMMSIEVLQLPKPGTVKELSGWSIPRLDNDPIKIDGSDPSNYKLAA